MNTRRWTATGVVGVIIFVLGLPSAMSFGLLAEIEIGRRGILDAIDMAVSNFLLPIGGILIAVYVGWKVERSAALKESELGDSKIGSTWIWLLRTVAPITVLAILLQAASTF